MCNVDSLTCHCKAVWLFALNANPVELAAVYSVLDLFQLVQAGYCNYFGQCLAEHSQPSLVQHLTARVLVSAH